MGATTDNPVVIIPAQFGWRYLGQSVFNSREIFAENELGLGVFEVIAMLLSNPGRLVRYGDQFIQCPGDDYSPQGDGDFSQVPCVGVRHSDNSALLYARWCTATHANYGSVTGFSVNSG